MNIKETLYNICLKRIEERLNTIQNRINDIQNSLDSETKSTAGDKHETGRAMLQLECEKAGTQLAEINKVKNKLSKINLKNSTKQVNLGSVVYTSNLNYFITISAGEIKIDHTTYYAISPATPIGKLLLGKQLGSTISFNDQSFEILSII